MTLSRWNSDIVIVAQKLTHIISVASNNIHESWILKYINWYIDSFANLFPPE